MHGAPPKKRKYEGSFHWLPNGEMKTLYFKLELVKCNGCYHVDDVVSVESGWANV